MYYIYENLGKEPIFSFKINSKYNYHVYIISKLLIHKLMDSYFTVIVSVTYLQASCIFIHDFGL